MHRSTSRGSGWGVGVQRSGTKKDDLTADTPGQDEGDNSNSGMPRLSMCADRQKVDRAKLAQTEVTSKQLETHF